jgi:Rrf2 family cysteine metabolism transcriptional repressor
MKVSTKGQYGIRAMFDLAFCYGQGPVPISKIAANQKISVAYLEQLFAKLRRAGLIRSVRGAQGGYELAKKPGDILFGNILRTLEGEVTPIRCVIDEGTCENTKSCPSWLIWKRLNDKVNEAIDSISLQDVLDDHEHLDACGATHSCYKEENEGYAGLHG